MMNEALNLLKTRRSVRKFKPDMPAKDDLEKIIEAGIYAPSGGGKQSAMIIAVTDKKVKDCRRTGRI